MANTCFTSWVLQGPKEDIDKIFRQVEIAIQNERDELAGKIKLQYRTSFTLLKNLGANPPEKGVDYRMEFYNSEPEYEENGDTTTLTFMTEDAWSANTSVMSLLKKAFPQVRIFYSCEEDEMAVYFTNDKDSVHFPDRFHVHGSYPDEECIYEDFKTGKDLLEWVNGEFADKMKKDHGTVIHADSIKEAKAIDDILQDISEDSYIYIDDIRLDENAFWLTEEAA